MERKDYKKYIKGALILLPAAIISIVCLIVVYSGWAEGYAAYFSRPLRHILGNISSIFPFSLMEVLCTAFVVWAVYYAVRGVYLTVKSEKKAETALKRAFVLLSAFVYIAVSFFAVFGVDYQSESFSEKSGLNSQGVTTQDLISATKYFARLASETSYLVPRDENGSVVLDMDEIFAYAASSYQGAEKEFSFLGGKIFTPKKMLFSAVMSYMGFTGIYFPFTGESNVNVHQPDAGVPSTITHEIAHQKGFTSEAECNFIGILAAVTCDNDAYRYSGYLSGLAHLLNALVYADTDAWREIYSSLPETVLKDFSDKNEYWDKMEISLTQVTEGIYDSYLKINGQSLGMASYGACTNLLVAYFAPMESQAESLD